MDHVAILNPSWKLLPKLLSGEKTIETRWYVHKFAPWNQVNVNDTIYFKDSAKPITAMGKVQKVEQHEFSSPTEMLPILLQYKNSLGFTEDSYTDLTWLNKKRYGILIFLDKVVPIQPFLISKKGFGSAAAWLCLPKKIDEYKLTVT